MSHVSGCTNHHCLQQRGKITSLKNEECLFVKQEGGSMDKWSGFRTWNLGSWGQSPLWALGFVPGSPWLNSSAALVHIANWSASCQLGFLISQVCFKVECLWTSLRTKSTSTISKEFEFGFRIWKPFVYLKVLWGLEQTSGPCFPLLEDVVVQWIQQLQQKHSLWSTSWLV